MLPELVVIAWHAGFCPPSADATAKAHTIQQKHQPKQAPLTPRWSIGPISESRGGWWSGALKLYALGSCRTAQSDQLDGEGSDEKHRKVCEVLLSHSLKHRWGDTEKLGR